VDIVGGYMGFTSDDGTKRPRNRLSSSQPYMSRIQSQSKSTIL